MHLACDLWFDGGIPNNGSGKGGAYGSYCVWGCVSCGAQRIKFPELQTNNEAEYMALIKGLRHLLNELDKHDIPARRVNLAVRGDSQLVVEQINGRWRCHKDHLHSLCEEACDLLNNFAATTTVRWHSRKQSVARFGH